MTQIADRETERHATYDPEGRANLLAGPDGPDLLDDRVGGEEGVVLLGCTALADPASPIPSHRIPSFKS